MAISWTIKSYCVSKAETVIDEWIASASDSAAAKFDSRLSFLASRLPGDWQYEYAHKLKGDCEGLWEIKFEADKIAHRPLFCFGPGRLGITFVMFAVEHNNKLKPPDACKSGLKRCKEIADGTVLTGVYDEY